MSYNLQGSSGLNLVLTTAGFALGSLGGATTHSHTASLVALINGSYNATAPSGTTTPTVNSSQTHVSSVYKALPAGSALAVTAPTTGFRGALVLWTIDSGGTKRIRSTGWFESAGGAPLELPFPDVPVTEIPVAYHTLKAISTLSGTWTYGSSNFTGVTGMTTGTVVNVPGAIPPSTGGVVVLT